MAPVGQAPAGQLPPQAVIYRDTSCHRNDPAGAPFPQLSCGHASTGWGESPVRFTAKVLFELGLVHRWPQRPLRDWGTHCDEPVDFAAVLSRRPTYKCQLPFCRAHEARLGFRRVATDAMAIAAGRLAMAQLPSPER